MIESCAMRRRRSHSTVYVAGVVIVSWVSVGFLCSALIMPLLRGSPPSMRVEKPLVSGVGVLWELFVPGRRAIWCVPG